MIKGWKNIPTVSAPTEQRLLHLGNPLFGVEHSKQAQGKSRVLTSKNNPLIVGISSFQVWAN